MAKCNKCNSYKCRCKKLDLTTIPTPCSTPRCIPKRTCTEQISWNCVIIGDSGILLTDPSNPNVSLYVKEGTNLNSFFLQYTLFNDPATRPCVLTGGSSRAVIDYDVYFDGNALIYQWVQVNNSDLLTGWSVEKYRLYLKDIATNVTIFVDTPYNVSSFTVPPSTPISYTSGTILDVWIETHTKDGSTPPNTAICTTLKKRITIP